MNKIAIALFVLGAPCATSSCVQEPTPVQRATSVASLQCADPRDSQDEARVLQETTVLKAEPITFHAGMSTRSEGGFTVGGTKLFVRAPDGVSADEMTRILQCHVAKALLGQVDPASLANDPYYLPNTWVDVDARPEQGFMVVRLIADRVWQNLAVLHRATAFADAHRQVPSPH
jgi:hypothetical protein